MGFFTGSPTSPVCFRHLEAVFQAREMKWLRKKLQLVISMVARSLLGRNPIVVNEEEDEEQKENYQLFPRCQ